MSKTHLRATEDSAIGVSAGKNQPLHPLLPRGADMRCSRVLMMLTDVPTPYRDPFRVWGGWCCEPPFIRGVGVCDLHRGHHSGSLEAAATAHACRLCGGSISTAHPTPRLTSPTAGSCSPSPTMMMQSAWRMQRCVHGVRV